MNNNLLKGMLFIAAAGFTTNVSAWNSDTDNHNSKADSADEIAGEDTDAPKIGISRTAIEKSVVKLSSAEKEKAKADALKVFKRNQKAKEFEGQSLASIETVLELVKLENKKEVSDENLSEYKELSDTGISALSATDKISYMAASAIAYLSNNPNKTVEEAVNYVHEHVALFHGFDAKLEENCIELLNMANIKSYIDSTPAS